MKKYSSKQLKALTLFISTIGLFGFILCRKNVAASFTLQGIATVSAVTYCFIKTEEELNPLSEAWKELETERERINEQYTKDCQQFDEDKERLKVENQEVLQEQKEYFLVEQKRIVELYEHELQLYIEQLQLKEDFLRKAKLPKLANGISRTEYYANKIISYLFENGIDCDFADSWEESAHDLIRLIPKNGATKKDLEKHSEQLQLDLRLSTAPAFEIVQGCIQLRIDTHIIETASKEKKNKLTLVAGDWLTDIAKDIIHARVNGETGSGKSSFVCNLANILTHIHKSAEFISNDPKYPLSLDWELELSDWQRKPKYKGIESALQGLVDMTGVIKHRLDLVTIDVENNKKPRKFNKQVWLIDEIDWIISDYGNDATNELRTGLKVGRALEIVIIYLGQTDRCSRLKMTKDDFRNTTNISLGSNIPDAIELYVHDQGLAKELLELYWLENNRGNKYLALVAQVGKKPFLAQLPAPGTYKPISKTSNDKNLECSSINSYRFSETPDNVILKLVNDGLRDSEVVDSLWGLKPSRSDDYQQAVARVKLIRVKSDS